MLVLLADVIALFGSFLGVNLYEPLTYPLFYRKVFDNLLYIDFLPAFFKTFFFGFAVGIIGCFKGYYSDKGTEGVGHSANSAVVVSSVVIFLLDLIAVQFAEFFQ